MKKKERKKHRIIMSSNFKSLHANKKYQHFFPWKVGLSFHVNSEDLLRRGGAFGDNSEIIFISSS